MIRTKQDLHDCLSIELGQDYNRLYNKLIDFIVPSSKAYIRLLRLTEFYANSSSMISAILAKIYKLRLLRLSALSSITVPINVCDRGLTIYHHGTIVINGACKIGKNCCISNNVNIGATGGSTKAPIIGDDVYIGPGAVIFGDISIADGCYIGANAVVCKSIQEPHSVVVGVPAKIIKKDYVVWWKKNNLNR